MGEAAGDAAGGPVGTWDPLLRELQSVRRRAGEPSYAEIARSVVAQRIADGVPEHAARIAKSSVHDAFRLGRSRINVDLTRELVRALGEDPVLVDRWLAGPAGPEVPAEVPADEAPDVVAPPSRQQVVLLLLACVALNLAGREFVDFFRLPVYLDMVGTAIAAVALGPWRGAGVALATNVLGVAGSGWVSLPFAAVNVAGALVWGYGVHRWRLGRSLPRFLGLALLVAVVCSAVAVPILAAVYPEPGAGHDAIMRVLSGSGHSFWASLGLANLLTSTADKLISGFVALVVVSALPVALRSRVPLAVPVAPVGPVRA